MSSCRPNPPGEPLLPWSAWRPLKGRRAREPAEPAPSSCLGSGTLGTAAPLPWPCPWRPPAGVRGAARGETSSASPSSPATPIAHCLLLPLEAAHGLREPGSAAAPAPPWGLSMAPRSAHTGGRPRGCCCPSPLGTDCSPEPGCKSTLAFIPAQGRCHLRGPPAGCSGVAPSELLNGRGWLEPGG